VIHSISSRQNFEEIVKTNPVFVFADPHSVGAQFRNLLNELNVKYATVLEWEETGNAETLEWIKFFAAFFNIGLHGGMDDQL